MIVSVLLAQMYASRSSGSFESFDGQSLLVFGPADMREIQFPFLAVVREKAVAERNSFETSADLGPSSYYERHAH